MIKTLYANGCSWTAGDGVEDDPLFSTGLTAPWIPSNYAWPLHLSQALNAEVINDAIGGGSNQRIVRKTVEFVQRLPENQRPHTAIVIGWTSPDRQEIFGGEITLGSPDGWCRFNQNQDFAQFDHGLSKNRLRALCRHHESHILNAIDHTASMQIFFQQVYLLQNLLENLKIPFLFFMGMPADLRCENELAWDNVKSNNILDLRNSSMFTYLSSKNIPLGPSIHPLIDGHKAWALNLFEELYTRKILK